MGNSMSGGSKKSNASKSGNRLIKIIGFGNIFMGDDGVGIKAIEALRESIKQNDRYRDNKDIEIVDGGTSGVDLVFLIRDAKKVIIVDAVDAGQQVGQIVTFIPEDIKGNFKKRAIFKSFSLHDMNLAEIFELIKTLKLDTEIKIIGIKPKKVGYSDSLSGEIEAKIPDLVSMIYEELES
ncbi:MAG: hydrogenase maturation protease [Actinobacteria bacterium]|nr:hydrogenase maturation protease [Actinomycetota bacterium]